MTSKNIIKNVQEAQHYLDMAAAQAEQGYKNLTLEEIAEITKACEELGRLHVKLDKWVNEDKSHLLSKTIQTA